LKVLISAGDSLTPQVARKALLYCPDGDVFNAYGPTENTGFSTCFLIAENDTLLDTVPIGQAVSNSGAVVMDCEQRLIPAGVLGELVVKEMASPEDILTLWRTRSVLFMFQIGKVSRSWRIVPVTLSAAAL
jgi:acyl-coenzyme A synthetase/AMP-(fatty) acid ligase